jgi:hypothetical protein
MPMPADPEAVRAELIARLAKVRGVLRLGLVLGAIIACATAVSWTIALVALRPACEAHAEKRHLAYDGMALSFFGRGNRVSPCRFRDRQTGAPADVVRWRSLDGPMFLVEIGVRPDLMSYILGGLGLTGWLFLTPTGRALRRKPTQ